MKSKSLRILVAVGALVILLAVCFRLYVSHAYREWTEVGGTIAWNEHFFFGAKRVGIGGAPGVRVSTDDVRVNIALRKINLLPFCSEMSINCSTFQTGGGTLLRILKGVTLDHLNLTSYSGEVAELEEIVKECKCKKLTFVSSHLSTIELQKLSQRLNAIDIRAIDIHRVPYFQSKNVVTESSTSETEK